MSPSPIAVMSIAEPPRVVESENPSAVRPAAMTKYSVSSARPVGSAEPIVAHTITELPATRPCAGESMVFAVTPAAVTSNARRADAPAGDQAFWVPTVDASYVATARTVVPAGTSNTWVPDIALDPADAADQVKDFRAYAGEPPVTSLPVVGGNAVWRLRNGVVRRPPATALS